MTNTSSSSGTTMYFTLYRVSGGSSTYVGSTSVSLTAGQSTSISNVVLASGQPAGTYRLEASSTYAVIGGLSYYSS